MPNLGPDVWGLPESSALIGDLISTLTDLRSTVAGWPSLVFAHSDLWAAKFDTVAARINDALAMMSPGDVFASRSAAAAYSSAIAAYARVHDELATSPDQVDARTTDLLPSWLDSLLQGVASGATQSLITLAWVLGLGVIGWIVLRKTVLS
jgi:hypothetical protein